MRLYYKKGILIIFLLINTVFNQEMEEEETGEEILVEDIYEKEFVKLNINKAEFEEILNIPGVSKGLAKKILEERKNGFYINFEDFKNRLNLPPEYDYLENYLEFNILVFNFYQETKGYYNDKYGENKFYRSIKGKVKGLYSIFDFGLSHYNYRDIDKFFGEIKYKGIIFILGDYLFEFGKGLLFGKYFAYSNELFNLPSNLKRINPTISYSRNVGIKGAALTYRNTNLAFAFKKDTFLTSFVAFPIERFEITSLLGFLRDIKLKKNLPFISLTGSIYGPIYFFYETGFINNNLYIYAGIRKIYNFSKLSLFFYSLPSTHISYFNTKFDYKREGKDEIGAGVRWEGKVERLILRIDERLFIKSEREGGYESYIRGFLRLNKPLNFTFELRDRKTTVHRLRFKNELKFDTKDFELSNKMYFEWDNYLLTSPGVLGGIEIKRGIFFFGIYSYNINSYSKRIYVYEAEPPTSFYLEPLYGNGSRVYLGVKFKGEMLYILAKYSENISERVHPDRRIIFIITVKNY
ncbi:MAG: helix-hairpin-helix domain-containing protein [Candidatus Hydrothermales bacterium]